MPEWFDSYEVWRVWRSGRATLEEMETHWSICDLWKASLMLDLEEDAHTEAEMQIEPPKDRR